MKKIFLASFFFMIIISCSNKNFENQIVKNIDKKLENNSCLIKMKDITTFPWDKMYVFKYTATLEQIENTVGTPLPKYTEFTRKIIFTLNGKIIYFEEEETDIEDLLNKEVVFNIPDSLNYLCFLIDKATFNVKIKNFEKGKFYDLNQIK